MDNTLLNYDSVEVSFNGNPVVHDVSFSLHSGEILGLDWKNQEVERVH